MPAKEPQFHEHPRNMHDKVYGVKLETGDTLEPTDVYSSSNGFWEPCPCPGNPLGDGSSVTWIRPQPLPAGTIVVPGDPRTPRR